MSHNLEFDLRTAFRWEDAALKELQFAYNRLLGARSLPLRAATIALMDSSKLWGQWDPQTRTISIARKLVQNHSWFHVLGVLRHEVAHQWVTEGSPEHGRSGSQTEACASGHDATHGARFRLACQLIGVPEEFKNAGADLQEESPDWRRRKRDEQSEKLAGRVEKLLALATSSNEHEALLAMNKVRELHARYQIENSANATKVHFSHLVIPLPGSRMEAHHTSIASILSTHFFVKVLIFKLYDASKGKHFPALELIGTRENTLMAEYVYHFLLNEMDYLVREKVKQSSQKPNRIEKKSYRLGILEGFAEKLKLAEKPVQDAASSSSSSKSALSLIGYAIQTFKGDSKLDFYMNEIYPRIGTRRSLAPAVDFTAFVHGKEAGRSITLNRAVSNHSGNRGRLLSHEK